MLVPLLWIIGSYAACIALVHLVHLFHKTDASRETWVMITRNHQHIVEWMLRILLFLSWLKGKAINLIVIDHHSSDDTLKIIERMARHNAFHWTVVHSESEMDRIIAGLAPSGVRILDLEQTDCPFVPQLL